MRKRIPIKRAALRPAQLQETPGQRERVEQPMPLIIEKNPVDLNGNASILIAFLFTTAPVRSKRYYLPQDSLLDRSTITRIEAVCFPVLFGQFVKVNEVIYNTVLAPDLAAAMITVKDSNRDLVIQNMPLNKLLKFPFLNSFISTGNLTVADTNRGRTDFNITILTGESWIQFSAPLTTPLPIAFLLSINYKQK